MIINKKNTSLEPKKNSISGLKIEVQKPLLEDSSKAVFIIRSGDDTEPFIKDCHKIYSLYKNNNVINNKTFCGIDLEFNMNWKLHKHYIAFMQIIFVFDSDKYYDESFIKPIYIINPLKLSTSHLKLFIKYVLCSGVIKIFHGSDSLDYPHIYKDLLNNKKKTIYEVHKLISRYEIFV